MIGHLSIAVLFSSPAASLIDSSTDCHQHLSMADSVATKAFFVSVGTPSVVMVSFKSAWPPPVDICPHTAATYYTPNTSHYPLPQPCVMSKTQSPFDSYYISHWEQMPYHCSMFHQSETFPMRHDFEWELMSLTKDASCCRLMIRLPSKGFVLKPGLKFSFCSCSLFRHCGGRCFLNFPSHVDYSCS